MKINVHGKNLQVSSSLQDYVERKLGGLSNWFDGGEVQVTLSIQGHQQLHVVEATINSHGIVLRAEEKRNDMYTSIDLVADKLESQIRKLKGKIKNRIRQQGGLKEWEYKGDTIKDSEKEAFELVRVKTVPIKPVDIEEAILQMNMLDHSFHLFYNRESNKTELVYKRNDGTYGLITTT